MIGNRAITAWIKRVTKKMHESLFPLVPSVCFVFLFCATVLGDNTGLHALPRISEQRALAAVTVKSSDLYNETIYSIFIENCTIDWIARNSEIGVIVHRARCNLPLSLQLPLLRQICTEFFSKDKNAPAFRTLFWGSLRPMEVTQPHRNCHFVSRWPHITLRDGMPGKEGRKAEA